MSRWTFVCLLLGIGGGSALAASPITSVAWQDPLIEETSGAFRSFFAPGEDNYLITSLWDRIQAERDAGVAARENAAPSRALEKPSVDQSILWAASRAEGPVQAFAVEHMPDMESPVSLLVDFRNPSGHFVIRGNLADLPTAFLGATPDLPSLLLVAAGLLLLAWSRWMSKRHRVAS